MCVRLNFEDCRLVWYETSVFLRWGTSTKEIRNDYISIVVSLSLNLLLILIPLVFGSIQVTQLTAFLNFSLQVSHPNFVLNC